MGKKTKIILGHLGAFLVLGISYFFCSEVIVKWLFPEIHDVVLWLYTVTIGLGLLLAGTFISCLLFLRRYKKKSQ